MSRLFIEIINNAITASWLIIVIILLRLIFMKMPKWIHCLLWGLVALRLIMPFSIESSFSLVPDKSPITINTKVVAGQEANDELIPIDKGIDIDYADYFASEPVAGDNSSIKLLPLCTVIWLIGISVMILYMLISCGVLRSRVSAASKYADGIFECDGINSPFILGMIRPRIYLPSGMKRKTIECVLAHERTHIKRGDHFWKPIGFLILSVYWFDPLCWVSYILLCRDIEYACDEKATRDKDKEWRAEYCQALLDCSAGRKMIAACPVAFGEVGVKDRIKSVINYKKPAFWVILVSVVVCVIVAVCFVTDRNGTGEEDVKPQSVGTSKEVLQELTETNDNTETDTGNNSKLPVVIEEKAFVNDWAAGFCDEDESLEKYSVQLVTPYSATIYYYAKTTKPHIVVMKQRIEYTESGDSDRFTMTDVNNTYHEYISNVIDFMDAYPNGIDNTMMDYTVNGLAEELNTRAILSSSYEYRELFEPESAAGVLLNLSDTPDKIELSRLKELDDGSVLVNIHFNEDDSDVVVKMIQPCGKDGIWIPKDYDDVTEAVLNAYNEAREIAWWFRGGTMDCVMNDTVVVDGIEYARTKNFATKSELEQKMKEVFTEEYADYLFENSLIEYREIEGTLYAVVADRGTDQYMGEEEYFVSGYSYMGKLFVKVEVLNQENLDEVIGYRHFAFPYVVRDGKVLFSDFPEIR